jgi:hypothetical protein
MNEREKLFSRLQSKPKSDREAAEDAIKAAAAENEAKGATEAKLATKVQTINGKRSRFVDAVAVPPDRVVTGVELVLKDMERAQKEEDKRSMGLTGEKMEAARRKMEEMLLSGADEVQSIDDSLSHSTKNEKTRSKKDALRKRMLMRSLKTDVKYGRNRVTSTHMSKGVIEKPWSTTTGRYTVREGDRTA